MSQQGIPVAKGELTQRSGQVVSKKIFVAVLALAFCFSAGAAHAKSHSKLLDTPYAKDAPPPSWLVSLNAYYLIQSRLLKEDETIVNDRTVVSPLQGGGPFTVFISVDMDTLNRQTGATRKVQMANTATLTHLQGSSNWVWQGFPLDQQADKGLLKKFLHRNQVDQNIQFIYLMDGTNN